MSECSDTESSDEYEPKRRCLDGLDSELDAPWDVCVALQAPDSPPPSPALAPHMSVVLVVNGAHWLVRGRAVAPIYDALLQLTPAECEAAKRVLVNHPDGNPDGNPAGNPTGNPDVGQSASQPAAQFFIWARQVDCARVECI
jgi:hypothetical protein